MPLKKVLVATDFSATAEAALEEAALLAGLARAEVVLLNVLPTPDPGIPTGIDLGLLPSWSAIQQMLKERQKAVQGSLESERARLEKDGLKVQIEIREGTPGAEIARAARELGADLVVMGTHGRSGFSHFFLGSTSDTVVRAAHCPVLLVRHRRGEEREAARKHL
jgi:nucleotide-binding universal stress UspA family protein